ncbi:hypothetical protein BpHYR1_031787 [Brachionus plicatilis]|uniref:Uncharacterized protein n=1 Tax=Brachionus plicatilis TaxID=10195 RepID=A0A3M7PSR8_BRAPC|nr:hypothetical protein BpHYR1_031787 [Brachionus plicatilis]
MDRDIAIVCDDLATLFIFNKIGNLENMINEYLKEVDKWLFKWKMKGSYVSKLKQKNKGKFYRWSFGFRVSSDLKKLMDQRVFPISFKNNRDTDRYFLSSYERILKRQKIVLHLGFVDETPLIFLFLKK